MGCASLPPLMLVAIISTVFSFLDPLGEVLNQGGSGPVCVFWVVSREGHLGCKA